MARLWSIAPVFLRGRLRRRLARGPDLRFAVASGGTATLLSLLPLVLVLALLAATPAASCAAASIASALAGGTAAASISDRRRSGILGAAVARRRRSNGPLAQLPEPEALRQRRPLRRVIGRDHRIVGRQAPFRGYWSGVIPSVARCRRRDLNFRPSSRQIR